MIYKRLTFSKVNESRLHDFFNKVGINMSIGGGHDLTTVRGYIDRDKYKQLLKGISAIKHGQDYISIDMMKVHF